MIAFYRDRNLYRHRLATDAVIVERILGAVDAGAELCDAAPHASIGVVQQRIHTPHQRVRAVLSG